MPAPPLLPIQRAKDILQRLRAAFARPKPRIGFAPIEHGSDFFTDDLAEALGRIEGLGVELVLGFDADIVLVTCHGNDLSRELWDLRLGGFAGVLAAWFYDNHGWPAPNLSTAVAADVLFPSHSPFAAVLGNPVSILARHLPLCGGQLSRASADRLARTIDSAPRSDRLFGVFVDYPESGRTAFLRRLAEAMPESDVRIVPAARRDQIFGKSKDERFAEWSAHKVSVVVPVNRDLSTRFFDALVAGEAIIASDDIPDLDVVIPRERQEQLGIMRFPAGDAAAAKAAAARALAAFDAGGAAGIRARHELVRRGHMLEDRLETAVRHLRDLADGRVNVRFTLVDDRRAALTVAA